MDKEEIKKLKVEYKKMKRSKYDKSFDIFIHFSVISSLIIFWLPTNILSEYSWLKYFTDFMSKFFPNINIYAQKSLVPELTTFYFSYMWFITVIMTIIIFSLPSINENAKEYFGTGEYKGKGILPYRYLRFVPSYSTVKGVLAALFAVILFGIAIHGNYTGWIIDDSIGRLEFGEIISTRLGMFFISNIFQIGAILMGLVNLIYIFLYMTAIVKFKEYEYQICKRY